ncbi:hypothetical protein EYF80_057715 [Liparis tanakae]|uniref:Uncharacterized protein n=1 Tax=Liparis tanakae TaxID=230148 RepID=A0A4Z2ET76_9TELE|nr:hypothetical protein EYF80_057715 [Liparis tanakae]
MEKDDHGAGVVNGFHGDRDRSVMTHPYIRLNAEGARLVTTSSAREAGAVHPPLCSRSVTRGRSAEAQQGASMQETDGLSVSLKWLPPSSLWLSSAPYSLWLSSAPYSRRPAVRSRVLSLISAGGSVVDRLVFWIGPLGRPE